MGLRTHQTVCGVETYPCLGLNLKSMLRGTIYSIFCVPFQPNPAPPPSPAHRRWLKSRAGLLEIGAGRQLWAPCTYCVRGEGLSVTADPGTRRKGTQPAKHLPASLPWIPGLNFPKPERANGYIKCMSQKVPQVNFNMLQTQICNTETGGAR